jgi:hypothetical protein
MAAVGGLVGCMFVDGCEEVSALNSAEMRNYDHINVMLRSTSTRGWLLCAL